MLLEHVEKLPMPAQYLTGNSYALLCV
jgi:hypothetical protein